VAGVDDEDGRNARFSNSKRRARGGADETTIRRPPGRTTSSALPVVVLQAARLADEWPDKREVLYIVDVPGSASRAAFVLKLAMRDRKADGGYTRVAPLDLSAAGLRSYRCRGTAKSFRHWQGGVCSIAAGGYTRDNDDVPSPV